jgi:glycosyltransferase involved in cell wall biosynthesis
MISIVIPTYEMNGKGVAFLKRALDSINKQQGIDLQSVEVIISDQSINHQIRDFAQSYRSVFSIRHIPNLEGLGSISRNLNTGLMHAQGTYLKILFQDDFLVEETYLFQLLQQLDLNHYDAVFTGAIQSENSLDFFDENIPRENPFIIFGENSLSSPSTLTIHRRVLDSCSFDAQFQLFMDCEFYYRLLKEFPKVLLLPEIHIANGVWQGQTQHTFSNERYVAELQKILRKYEGSEINNLWNEYQSFLSLNKPWKHDMISGHWNGAVDPLHSLQSKSGNVDVILPIPLNATRVTEVIKSALTQTYPINRLWVLFCGANSYTISTVKDFFEGHSQVSLIQCASDFVMSEINACLLESNARWVALLEPECIWHPKKLEIQLEIATQNPGCALVLTNTEREHKNNFDISTPPFVTNNCDAIKSKQFCLLDCFEVFSAHSFSTILFLKEAMGSKFINDDPLASIFEACLQMSNKFPALFATTHLVTIFNNSSGLFGTTHQRNRLALWKLYSRHIEEALSNKRLLNRLRLEVLSPGMRTRLSFLKRMNRVSARYDTAIQNLHPKLKKAALSSLLSIRLSIAKYHLISELKRIVRGLQRRLS